MLAERVGKLDIEAHCFSYAPTDLAYEAMDYYHEANILDTDTITEICKREGINRVIYPTAVIAKNIRTLGKRLNMQRIKYFTRKG